MAKDRYETLARPSHAEIPKVKGSRFIADAVPVESVDDAERELEKIRRQHRDATHHCFAYRLGAGGESFRSSDDGEPSGSAGAPILRQIESSGLSDVLVVVTRFFGGTKLGTGGLARAYGDAASLVLHRSVRRIRQLYGRLELAFAYDDTSPVMHLVERFDARVLDSRYGEGTVLSVEVPLSSVEDFLDAFVEALGGRGGAERC